MSHVVETESDFASAMHELSAEAVAPVSKRTEPDVSGTTALIGAIHDLNQRIEGLEETVLRRLEAAHLERIEEQLAAIRDSETVNQKLFDSLHQELISYRDNFVRDALQKPIIRDLLVLFDDLSGLVKAAGGQEGNGAPQNRSHDNLTNILHFLVEILHRLEVSEIEPKETVDRALHRVISFEPAESAEEDGRIVRRLKRGFTWHGRVLRAEEVVAKRFQ